VAVAAATVALGAEAEAEVVEATVDPAVGAVAVTEAAPVETEATEVVEADALAAQGAGLAIGTAMCLGARFALFAWMT